MLSVKEFRLLKELAKEIDELKVLLKSYEKKGYISESSYNNFKDLEEEYSKK